MSVGLRTDLIPATLSQGERSQRRVREFLPQVLKGISQSWFMKDRRQYARRAYPALMRLTPLDPLSLQPSGDAFVVVGKDLSEQGVGFFHSEPLPFRKAAVELNVLQPGGPVFLLDLTWCRSTQTGWYENGGRFLGVLEQGPSFALPK